MKSLYKKFIFIANVGLCRFAKHMYVHVVLMSFLSAKPKEIIYCRTKITVFEIMYQYSKSFSRMIQKRANIYKIFLGRH